MAEQTEGTKDWQDHTANEQQAILTAIEKVYEEYGNPSWLKKPTITVQIVTSLRENKLQNEGILQIEGNAPLNKKAEGIAIKQKLLDASKTVDKRQISITCAYGLGDKPGPIEKVNDVIGDCKTTVQHKPGQVILLDFWATWCPPCQVPMAHNQEMLTKRKDDWQDKVRLIGLSIDKSPVEVKKHVQEKGWLAVEHYHVRTEGCVADEEFGIRGVPHVLLLDTKGKIVFIGHPASRPNLEEDIDTLLAGNPITGEGTAPAGKPEEKAADEEESSSKKLTPEQAKEAYAKFQSGATGLLSSEVVKTNVVNCVRAFVVLVNESKYDPVTKEFTHDIEFITQLIGKESAVKAIEAEVTKFKEGPWKKRDIIKPM